MELSLPAPSIVPAAGILTGDKPRVNRSCRYSVFLAENLRHAAAGDHLDRGVSNVFFRRCHINSAPEQLIGREQMKVSRMDETTLREMMEMQHVSAFGWALHCCGGDHDEALDVLHSAYVSILEKGAQGFSGKSSFRTWLFSVIMNTARQHRSQIHRRIKRFQSLVFKPEPAAAGEEMGLHDSDSRNRMMKLLGGLSSRQKQVLQLVFYHDLTIEEAAEILGISVGSARTHYTRGKKRIRAAIEKAGESNE